MQLKQGSNQKSQYKKTQVNCKQEKNEGKYNNSSNEILSDEVAEIVTPENWIISTDNLLYLPGFVIMK